MSNDNKISIIVPVYNLEQYVERCIQSILQQTYKNIEVIIVNDGSSDNSWEIIQRLAELDKRIISVNKKNGGVTSARLEGIKKATGEWIGFVDGDDEIEADMYEMLLDNAIKYHADISHCGYQMVFEDARVNYFYNTGSLVKQDRITGLRDLLEGTRVEPGLCNKLFRKTLFESLLQDNKIPQDIKNNEDLLMNYYLFEQANLSVFEDVCKYRYIVRGNSASRVKLNKHRIFDPIRVKKIILEQEEKEIFWVAQKAYVSTCINVYNELVLEKGYVAEKKMIRRWICEKKSWFDSLSKKQRLLANLIYRVPFVYPFLYGFYFKFLLQNKYS